VGRSLGAAVSSYNAAVGSLEGRVLVTARRFGEMGVTNDELPAPRQVEDGPRSLSAPELEVDPPGRPTPAAHGGADHGFEALGDLARPGGAGPLVDGSSGVSASGTSDEAGRRARGA
jgi:DNA recombination protein RmuC